MVLRTCVGADPQNAVLLVDLARAYALRYRYADAEKLVDLAESLYPNNTQLQQMLGRSYVELQQFDRAIICYRRRLEIDKLVGRAAADAAGTREDAREAARTRCRQRVCRGGAWTGTEFRQGAVHAGGLDRRVGDLRAAESRWRAIIDEKTTPLGVIADSLVPNGVAARQGGRYDEAFEDLTRAQKKYSVEPRLRILDDAWTIGRNAGKTFSRLTPEHFERWSAAIGDLDPLTGGSRC